MDALILVIVTLAAVLLILCASGVIAQQDRDYYTGYHDGYGAHERLCEMTPDDEALLKEMKAAVKLYIKQSGLYRSGDVKNIESAADFKEFRDEAWKVTVLRKEKR